MQPRVHSYGENKEPAAKAALLLIGSSAIIGQIVLMRELIAVFGGNEILLGILLATWLFWTAAGSLLCNALARSGRHARRSVAIFFCVLGISMPLTLWALRLSKGLLQTVPGELVGPLPVLFASLICLSLFCATAGALFVATARLIGIESGLDLRRAVSKAYLLEAAGSAIGGILASLVLLRCLSPFQIAFLVLALNLSMACVLGFRMNRKRIAAATALTFLLAVFLLAEVAPRMEWKTQAGLWRGFHLLATRDSIYGSLAVIETGGMRSLYENGLILANAPDESASEESVHYALLEHPAPKRILIIGGGANRSAAQALQHPSVETIDLIELDPAIPRMAQDDFDPGSMPLDPRVHWHTADGRAFLNRAKASYDVIIVTLPNPQTAQLNRFYTEEFFRSARAQLAPGGLLSIQLRSSEETVSPDLAEFLRCVDRTLLEVFPDVVAIPGETIHFFAASRPGLLTVDPQTLVARLQARRLHTKYVREYFIPYRMSPDRMEQVRGDLRPLAATRINRDFAPIAYYFNTLLWSAQFKPAYAVWLRSAGQVRSSVLLGGSSAVLLAIAALFTFAPKCGNRARAAASSAMAATGFTLMALQILLLLAFQSIYGFLYSQLAILIALGMAGIAMGSWLGLRRRPRAELPPFASVAATQLLLALAAPFLMLLIGLLANITGAASTWLDAQCVFPALAALCGVLGGYQFTQSAQLAEDACRPSLGWLYAVDLLGGCAGALVLSGYLIPVFGFWRTAWLTAAVNLLLALPAARLFLFRHAQP